MFLIWELQRKIMANLARSRGHKHKKEVVINIWICSEFLKSGQLKAMSLYAAGVYLQ